MKYQHINLQINTLSPLHIGNGEKLTSIGEYHNTGKQLFIIDKEALHNKLKKEDLVKKYYELILNDGKETNVWNFLKENSIVITDFITNSYPINSDDFDATHNRFLELFIDSGKSKYIPGSSLKGGIRHYLFLYLIDTDTSLKHKIEQVIFDNDDLSKIKSEIKKIEQEVYNENNNYNHSDFIMFRPEDSAPIDDVNFIVEVANRLSLYEDFGDLGSLRLSVKKEVTIPFTLTIKISENIAAKFKHTDIFSIFDKINRVSQKYLEQELLSINDVKYAKFDKLKETLNNYLEQTKNTNKEFGILRLGKGRSFYFNTLLPFISNQAKNKVLELLLYNKVTSINNKIDKEKLNKNKIDLKNYINTFPHTRILTANSESFGWIKISKSSIVVNNFDVNELQKVTYIDNKIDELLIKKTKLTAYYKGDKKADFILNGEKFVNFKIVIDKIVNVEKIKLNQTIKLTVWQLKKTGELSQLKLEE